jgi:hypothetical protein
VFVASGMYASVAMLSALVPAGGHIVTTTDCYRKTRIYMETELPKRGISVMQCYNIFFNVVDMTAAVERGQHLLGCSVQLNILPGLRYFSFVTIFIYVPLCFLIPTIMNLYNNNQAF